MNFRFFPLQTKWLFRLVTSLLFGLLLPGYFCAAQTPVLLMPVPQPQYFTFSGLPLAFGCVFTYSQNTTAPLATYTDVSGTTQNANPVVLSAGGTASIWIQAGVAYTVVVKSSGGLNCASGSMLYTVNGIGGGVSTLTTIVTYSATPTFQVASQNQLFKITLTGNASSQPLTVVGITPPGLITWEITQDNVGGHTFTWPANSIGGCTIGANANQVTLQHFVWDGTTAIATGPCVTGNGPIISAGNIYDYGVSLSSPLCTDVNKQIVSTCNSVLGITVNGQTINPGGSGNVNAGAAAHSLATNEGAGAAMVGLPLGNNQIAVGQTSADPVASTLPTCGAGSSLTFSGTLPLTCNTPVGIQASSITTLGGDVNVSNATITSIIAKAVTMPATGCPCRAFVSYSVRFTNNNSGVLDVNVNDGTNSFASSELGVAGSFTNGQGMEGSSYSTGTYSNGANITFTLRMEQDLGETVVVKAAPHLIGQGTFLNVAIVTSN